MFVSVFAHRVFSVKLSPRVLIRLKLRSRLVKLEMLGREFKWKISLFERSTVRSSLRPSKSPVLNTVSSLSEKSLQYQSAGVLSLR